MSRPVRIVVERAFRHDIKQAYAWLTDFEEADVERAGAVVEKRVIRERGPDRVVYEGETEVLGRRAWSVTEVLMEPPHAWHARVIDGPRKGSFTDYTLTPTDDGCRLVVDYRFVLDSPARTFLLRTLRLLVKRELHKMWDGYTASMDAELAQPM